MQRKKATPERLGAFSDGVIAVIITIMVLELKPPGSADLTSLLPLWPTLLSYAVSYLFVGIIWVNHHHLLRFTDNATPMLVWTNLGFLFTVSLIPFSTAWLAATRLSAGPVAFYALLFCLVNVTYIFFERSVFDQPDLANDLELQALRQRSRVRARTTLLCFAVAGGLALRFPIAGFVLIFLTVLMYLVPDRFTAASFRGSEAQPRL